MNTYEQDLKEAAAYHGHLCSGQILGVRMARMGMKLLGISESKHSKELIVYVECDRCLADAIGTVTGCKIGKRSLKWMDYGKTAATFVNIETGKAVRIYRKYRLYPPEGSDLVEFYNTIKDEEMFVVQEVKVNYRPEDLPGKPLDSMTCPCCKEEVIDGRQIIKDGVAMCKACGSGSYYEMEERR
jgi:formylmethanofuran dehydrogenase subunit E